MPARFTAELREQQARSAAALELEAGQRTM
jgi:hypothetical protein